MEARFDKLREEAYNVLALNTENNAKRNIDSLIEELLLHQVELELQNASLAEAYSQLEVSNKKYTDLYTFAPLGYFTLNEQAVISDVNTAASELLGVNKSALIDKRFMQYVAKDSRSLFSNYFLQMISANSVRTCEIKMIKGDKEFSAKLEGKMLKERNSYENKYLIIVSDLTPQQIAEENTLLRKLNEEAEKNSRVKDVFLATLSHELRTPITAILCWTQTLRNKLHDQVIVGKGLQSIEENILIQNHLVNDLLDISSIVLGKVSIELIEIDLIAAIHSAVDSVQLHATEKNISIEFKTEIPEVILPLDTTRMRQIFYNLIMNAIKFTADSGKIEILVREHRDEILIEIMDNGEGIAPEFLPHIFERFTQGSVFLRSNNGLGLGLALVSSFLELQGGTIAAASEGIGMGTKFTITFKKSRIA